MKRFVISLLITAGAFLVVPSIALAATNTDVAQFTNQTFSALITLASLASVFFLVRGGLQYITSTGKPEELEHAKKTVRNALIGLVIVISAGVISALLHNAFTTPSSGTVADTFKLTPIQAVEPPEGVTRVLVDAIVGFLQTIIQSATKPIVDGIIGFLTVTPSFITNSVVFNFWLVIVGIVDSLFVLVIALLGFHVMSASTFGFDEIEFKHLLPRIGLSFLLANTSIFLIDWVISVCNVLIQTVLNTTGGITKAWVLNAFDPKLLTDGAQGAQQSTLITLIFMILFIILAIVLLLMYITRLITISVGAVLSPFIFLLWAIPEFSDFAKISIKAYLVTIFTVFVHVVIIQLASSFLTLPGQSGTNSLISILVGIATLFTLLKAPGVILQFTFYSAANGAIRKLGGQIIHVVSSKVSSSSITEGEKITRRRIVNL